MCLWVCTWSFCTKKAHNKVSLANISLRTVVEACFNPYWSLGQFLLSCWSWNLPLAFLPSIRNCFPLLLWALLSLSQVIWQPQKVFGPQATLPSSQISFLLLWTFSHCPPWKQSTNQHRFSPTNSYCLTTDYPYTVYSLLQASLAQTQLFHQLRNSTPATTS